VLVAFIAFLLLAPSSKIEKVQIEKPKVLWLQDLSHSIDSSGTAPNKDVYFSKFEEIATDLNLEWETLPFSGKWNQDSSSQYLGTSTNVSEALKSAYDGYFNQNIAAVILASDGIYNQGYDPRYVQNNKNWPLFGWMIGDSAKQVDSKIDKVFHNKIAYKGNQFPIEVSVRINAPHEGLELELLENSQVLARKKIPSNVAEHSFKFLWQEEKAGLHTYRLRLTSLSNEKNLNNNEYLLYINIVENKKKILFISNSSHPDIAAIKSAIEDIEEYEFEIKKPIDITSSINDYNLLVLHQIPNRAQANLNSRLAAYKGNVLYMTGEKSIYNRLNSYQSFFKYQSPKEMESVKVHGSTLFTQFNLNPEIRSFFTKAPPLWSNQAPIVFEGKSEQLYNAQIFTVKTNQPVITFGTSAGRNYGLINGQGLWQWKLYDYRLNKSNDYFNILIRQMIRYMVSKESLQRFQVNLPSRILNNESLEINAEVYNPSFELTTEAVVEIKFSSETDQNFDYILNASGNTYKSIVEGLPAGRYSFTAKAQLGEESFVKKGNLFIEPINLEMQNTRADYRLLEDLAQNNGGEVIMADDWELLQSKLEDLDAPSISHAQIQMEEWVNIKYLFIFLLFLLGGEWLLRKRYGTY
ncbi:MAG: hypothetical protein N4A46_15985, partial [Schleiferiaceae bacterium]|nr:hypothetical protein [Schleiferiaceae bacterium]